MRAKLSIALASVLVSALAATAPADAACKKFGFTVNDYGKEGPTNDAKNLLDKHIAEWAAQNGVSAYQTGKKSVSCELFLDVILFDEHTCTASANVCWGAGVKPNNGSGEQAAATDDAAAGNGEAPPHPVRKADALGIAPQAQQAAAVAPAAAAPAVEAAAVDAAPTTPVEQIAAPAETPAASPAVDTPAAAAAEATPPAATPPATAVVETGALQANQPIPTPEKKAAPGFSDKERAAAAAAAATAAAAAERAAMAAETAANAAKEAAAAAVAASAASKGPATVPPLDHASGVKPAHNE